MMRATSKQGIHTGAGPARPDCMPIWLLCCGRNLRQMRTDVAEQIRESGTGLSKPAWPASLVRPRPPHSGAHSGSRSVTPSHGAGAALPQQVQQPDPGSTVSPADSLASGGEVRSCVAVPGGRHDAGLGAHSARCAELASAGAASGPSQAPRRPPGHLSAWERLRRAAHALSRAQFRTCDWANEGDPQDFVLSQARGETVLARAGTGGGQAMIWRGVAKKRLGMRRSLCAASSMLLGLRTRLLGASLQPVSVLKSGARHSAVKNLGPRLGHSGQGTRGDLIWASCLVVVPGRTRQLVPLA